MNIIILDNEICIFKEYNLPLSTTVERLRIILTQDGLFNDKFQFLSINGEELMKSTFSRSIGSFVSIINSIDSPLVINVHSRSMETNNMTILSHNYALHMKKCIAIIEKTTSLMKAASDGFLIDCKKKEKEHHETSIQIPDEKRRDKNDMIPANIDLDDLTMAEFSLQPGNFDEGSTYCDNDTVSTSLSHMYIDRNRKQLAYFQTKLSSLDLEHELTDIERLRLLSFDGNSETADAEPIHQKWYSRKLNKTKHSFARFIYRYRKRIRRRV